MPTHEKCVAHLYEASWHIGSTLQGGPNRGVLGVPTCFSAQRLRRGKASTPCGRVIVAKAGNAAALISPVRTAPAKFPWTLALAMYRPCGGAPGLWATNGNLSALDVGNPRGDIIGGCQSLVGSRRRALTKRGLALGEVDLWDVDDNTTARSPLG